MYVYIYICICIFWRETGIAEGMLRLQSGGTAVASVRLAHELLAFSGLCSSRAHGTIAPKHRSRETWTSTSPAVPVTPSSFLKMVLTLRKLLHHEVLVNARASTTNPTLFQSGKLPQAQHQSTRTYMICTCIHACRESTSVLVACYAQSSLHRKAHADVAQVLSEPRPVSCPAIGVGNDARSSNSLELRCAPIRIYGALRA